MPIVRLLDGTLDAPPQKWWVLVWDGIRRSELFRPDLAPNFNSWVLNNGLYVPMAMDYSCSRTWTPSSHASAASGSCQLVGDDIDGDTRSTMPYWWEYLRKQFDLTELQVAVLSGKYRLRMLDHSDHPEYGPDYAAYFDYRLNMLGYDGDDSQVDQMTREYVEANDPNLVWEILAETDRAAHRSLGHRERYDAAITASDSFLRPTIEYALGRGYNVVLWTDHGRHVDDLMSHGPGTGHAVDCNACILVFAQMEALGDRSWRSEVASATRSKIVELSRYGDLLFECLDSVELPPEIAIYGGWMNHGCNCSGCQETFCVFFAPWATPGTVSPIVRSPIDILPTVAATYGLDVPYATGVRMNEVYNGAVTSVHTPMTRRESWGRVKTIFR